ncbi:MAG: 50S ribosomal protein L9 [Rhodospirillales bacterium]|nr:50S ribosomal protein L9 [Rhodospirillales bacterium]
MEIILLERVDNLGKMGDVVKVKTGYARNYLLPQNKALRATKNNVAYFEAQKASLEKLSAEKQKDAEKAAKKLDGAKVNLIRHASESGHLYGSVTSRDIAVAISEQSGETVDRQQVILTDAIKSIGLIPVTLALHPEVKLEITLNIARSSEEAKIQAETGRALVAGSEEAAEAEAAEAAKEQMLEDAALEAEKVKAEAAEAEAAEEAERAAKAAEKAAKKAAKEAEEASDEAEAPAEEEKNEDA